LGKLKVLNLYCCLGGNRKLWPKDIEVTAIELDPEIARLYKINYPQDKVIVGDAHEYLQEHYKEFDFIWSSPPCPTHSKMRVACVAQGQSKAVFPDLKLYEEIIFLQKYFKGIWVVENVISYYEPLIKPFTCHRHYFWSNFNISNIKLPGDNIESSKIDLLEKEKGFSVKDYKGTERKDKILHNIMNPKLGLHIFNCAFKEKQANLLEVFNK
jgi:DNA (cytosine-5)-methyltransferase 1